MTGSDFAGMIKKDREAREHHSFSGTLLDYLAILQENAQVAMFAHQRMYELLTAPGMETVKTEEDPRLKRIYGSDTLKRYAFFKDFTVLIKAL